MLNIHCRFVTYSTPETGVVPEGGGGGQFSPFRLYHPPPPSLRSSLRVQRRNGYCSPQRAQNDIQSFFFRPSSPPCLRGTVCWRGAYGCNLSPSLTGRARSLEDGLNVHLCLRRGELSSSTRGLDGVGPPSPSLPTHVSSIRFRSFYLVRANFMLRPKSWVTVGYAEEESKGTVRWRS